MRLGPTIDELRAEVEGLKGSKLSLEGEIVEVRASNLALEGKVGRLEGDIIQLQHKNLKLEGDVNGLTGTVDRIKADRVAGARLIRDAELVSRLCSGESRHPFFASSV